MAIGPDEWDRYVGKKLIIGVGEEYFRERDERERQAQAKATEVEGGKRVYKLRMDFRRRVIDANGVCHWESKHCYFDVPDKYVRTGGDETWQLEHLEMKEKVNRGIADLFEYASVHKEGGDNVYQ